MGEQREREVGASGKGLEEESAPNTESEQHAVSLFWGLSESLASGFPPEGTHSGLVNSVHDLSLVDTYCTRRYF